MMSTGIVRKLDCLGRVVLPKEIRDTLGLKEGSPMEIFIDGRVIMLREYQPFCALCGESGEIEIISGRQVCRKCLEKIRRL